MKTFLELVAEDLFAKIGNELSETAVVFPNKRASLFFSEYLAKKAGRPVWAPAFISISELFRGLTSLQAADSIRLVCELYKVYQEETGSKESLDDFYFWGELLISDFDDVDKNKVDATRLFTNLRHLQELGRGSDFLTDEQVAAIREFFDDFSIDKPTQLKEKFINIWDHLGALYQQFRKRLKEQGIAYEGMMYREAIEQLDASTLPYKHYVLVGFNVLNAVERELFGKLQEAGKAMFYWDYDVFYTNQPKHEAGDFINRNLRQFPNELTDTSLFDVMKGPKEVRYIAAPTENAQARFLHQWIDPQTWDANKEKEHAVVLCNEGLLLPVLHSIPSCVKNLNVTMGFPLSQTPVCSFINALMDLQTKGYQVQDGRFSFETATAVLKHPYTLRLSTQAKNVLDLLVKNNRFFPTLSELQLDEFLTLLFTPQQGIKALCEYLINMLQQVTKLYREETETEVFNQLYRESLFKSYTIINRLMNLIEEGTLTVQPSTFRRLLSRLLLGASIPFHGEPAIGMQIMGVLETRNLDFKDLLLLSVNEGKLPHGESEASFIPYNLRKAFGMTTIEHKISVYAYYFYRLIQRAEKVTLLYNTSTDGMNRGEMSRFMLQFLVDWPHEVTQEYLKASQIPANERSFVVEKDTDVIHRLYHRFDAEKDADKPEEKQTMLSPSAINYYIDCSMKFYFRYVAGLRVPDEVSADIDNALFGTIFHLTAQFIYEDLTKHGKQVLASDLETLLKEKVKLRDYVDRAFKEKFFKIGNDEKSQYNGAQIVNFDVILKYITQLLRNDCHHAPFSSEGMELKRTEIFPVKTPQGILNVRIGGVIDRMDSKGDTMRIIDYKTGKEKGNATNLEALFVSARERPYHAFQAFLYACIMSRKLQEKGQNMKIQPALYYIQKSADESYEPTITVGGKGNEVNDFAEQYEKEFRERLQSLLEEIFNPEVPFMQTEIEDHCKYCDFRQLCRR